ncbi:hypothetical protein SD208_16045 [Ochrobactrum sp. BD67]
MSGRSHLPFLLFVGFVCLVLAAAWHWPLMSPDSWALYDISRWLWHSEMVTGIRQYRVATDLPISHPFFYPALIGGLDQVLGTGFRSGLIVNALAILTLPWFIYLAIEPIAESKKNAVVISGVVTAGLCLNWFFLEEVIAGRTIPITACLMALALRFFFLGAQQHRLIFAAKLGLVLGVLALTRFDALSFSAILILGTYLVWAYGIKRWLVLLIVTALFCVGYSPYLIYSIQCCGTILATETQGIAAIAPPIRPTTYWPVIPPTLLEAPAIWMERLARSSFDSGKALVLALAISPLPMLLVFTSLFSGIVVKYSQRSALLPILPILALASMALGPVLLSFPQGRYFVLPIMFTCSIIAAYMGSALFDYSLHSARLNVAVICAGIVGIVGCGYGWSRSTPLLPPSMISAAAKCAAGARLLVKGQRGPEVATRGRVRTLLEPDNWNDLTNTEKDQFMHEYGVGAIFDPESGSCQRLRNPEHAS